MFKIVDPLEESKNNMELSKLRRRATDVAFSLCGEDSKRNELIGFARVVGIPVEGLNILTIESELVAAAEKDPGLFLDRWSNVKMRDILIVVKRGISTAVIASEPGRGYVYNGVPIAQREDGVIAYFSENPDALHAVDMESKRKDNMYQNPNGTPVKKSTETGGSAPDVQYYKNIAKSAGYPEMEWFDFDSVEEIRKYLEEKALNAG